MRNLEDVARMWQRGAVVLIQTAEAIAVRPAAFVFATPTGFAWVEPSYADPAAAPAPALHYRDGTLQDLGALFTMQAGAELIEVRAYEDDDADMIGDALDWFAGYLNAAGESWEDEREYVRGLINPASA